MPGKWVTADLRISDNPPEVQAAIRAGVRARFLDGVLEDSSPNWVYGTAFKLSTCWAVCRPSISTTRRHHFGIGKDVMQIHLAEDKEPPPSFDPTRDAA